MATELEQLTNLMLPEITSELRRIIGLVDKPGLEDLHFMLSYQMGWVGEKSGASAEGKRVRPLLVLLVNGAARGNWHDAIPSAAAVELIHNFSLIHDDIEDNSPLRRGRSTLWKQWGIPQAINTGDTMFTLANVALSGQSKVSSPEITLRANEILQNTCLKLTQGQYWDLAYESRNDLSVEDYWTMIEGKTATLIGTSTQLGALTAGGNLELQEIYYEYGLSLGLAFQVIDDMLGIWGDSEVTGKSIESDLVAGKKSLPVLYGLSLGGPFAERWMEGPIMPHEVPSVAKQLEDEGVYAYTQERAERYTSKAVSALHDAQPDGVYAAALQSLTNSLLSRQT